MIIIITILILIKVIIIRKKILTLIIIINDNNDNNNNNNNNDLKKSLYIYIYKLNKHYYVIKHKQANKMRYSQTCAIDHLRVTVSYSVTALLSF